MLLLLLLLLPALFSVSLLLDVVANDNVGACRIGTSHVCEQLHFGEVARIQVEVTDSFRNQSPNSALIRGEKSHSWSVWPHNPKVTEKKSTTCRISYATTWSTTFEAAAEEGTRGVG